MAKVGDTEMTVPPYGDATAQEPRCNTKVSTRCPEFCQLIGKRETKTTELSKRERDLRRRLEMLECWMPAVTMMGMMTRDIKADEIAGVIDKQVAGMTLSCLCPNSTLSQHRDVRIREVEGKRKKAMMRFEEARKLLNEKQTAVDRQNERIEEARRTRVMMEERVKLLEAKVSRYDNLGRATSAESVASIGPDELMYLTKLEELVKAEAASKKQLEELEKRQEMYVKALEAASQIWNDEERQESIASREDGLKSQLQVKSLANQQLADRICQLEDQVESLKSKLISCNDELKTYTERKSAEAMMGTDLTYRDVEVSIAPVLKDVSVIYDEVTVSGEKSPEAVLGPDGESRHLDLSGVTFREVSMIYDINFTVDEEVHAVAATESKETSAVIEFTERAVQEDIVQPQYDDAETATDGMQFVSLMAADATDATDGADADWQQSAVDGMQFVSLMAADATDAADADSQQSATHGMQFVSLMAADTTDAADADWQQSAAGDMQFVSLMEGSWHGGEISSPLVFDSSQQSEHAPQTRPKITKSDAQTQTADNYICIEIPEMKTWETNIERIHALVRNCDKCNWVEPEAVMIYKAIKRLLEQKREQQLYAGVDSDSSTDRLVYPSAGILAELANQPGTPGQPSGLMAGRLDEVKASDEILLAGGIGGVRTAGMDTPPATLIAPAFMSTPGAPTAPDDRRSGKPSEGVGDGISKQPPTPAQFAQVIEKPSEEIVGGITSGIIPQKTPTTPQIIIPPKPASGSIGSGFLDPEDSYLLLDNLRLSQDIPRELVEAVSRQESKLMVRRVEELKASEERFSGRSSRTSRGNLSAPSGTLMSPGPMSGSVIPRRSVGVFSRKPSALAMAASVEPSIVQTSDALSHGGISEARIEQALMQPSPSAGIPIIVEPGGLIGGPSEKSSALATAASVEPSTAQMSGVLSSGVIQPSSSEVRIPQVMQTIPVTGSEVVEKSGPQEKADELIDSRTEVSKPSEAIHPARIDAVASRDADETPSDRSRSDMRMRLKSAEAIDAGSVPQIEIQVNVPDRERKEADENELVVIPGQEEVIQDQNVINDDEALARREDREIAEEREAQRIAGEMIDEGRPGPAVRTDEAEGRIRDEGRVDEDNFEREGPVAVAGIPEREATLADERGQLQREIPRSRGDLVPGGVLCGADDSRGRVDGGYKCPVTAQLSSCICHALRRWPRMTRKEYQESREAVTKIPTERREQRKTTGTKAVSSATVESIQIQTNVRRINEVPDVPSETSGDVCDPCECDPCASVSSTSTENPIESVRPTVETRDYGVMAKIYRSRR